MVARSAGRAVMKAASSADSTGLGVNSRGTPAAAATGALAHPCGDSGSTIADSAVAGKAAPTANADETASAPVESLRDGCAGWPSREVPPEQTTETGRPASAATVSAGTEVGPANRTGTPRAAASADPARAWAGDLSGETRTTEAAGAMCRDGHGGRRVGRPGEAGDGYSECGHRRAVGVDTTPGHRRR